MCQHVRIAPAVYVCADCEIEHNGDATHLPQDWDRVTDPISHATTVRCPDCLEAIERMWIEARSTLDLAPIGFIALGPVESRYVDISRLSGGAV